MKQGKTLVELAQSLQDIRDNSRDFLVPVSKLSMNNRNELEFENGTKHFVKPNNYAHGQLASYAGVPKLYYDRLREENRELLARNVNHGLTEAAMQAISSGKPETRMVRTVGDNVRAFLSSSFRRLDSFDLCETVLPIISQKQMTVASSEITERSLYLKALAPKIQTEIKKGDVVQYGIVISNSDVGAGSLKVEPLIYRLVCQNGLITSHALKKFHIGKNLAVGDDISELLTAATQSATDEAFWMQVKDIVTASMNPQIFEREVDRLRAAADRKITNFDLQQVVELSMKAVGVSGEKTKDSIIAYLANGADGAGLTHWGLINAYTAAAQDDEVNYDQSIELERAGARVLELTPHQWRRIAEVA